MKVKEKCKSCIFSVFATDGCVYCSNISRWLTTDEEEQSSGCFLFRIREGVMKNEDIKFTREYFDDFHARKEEFYELLQKRGERIIDICQEYHYKIGLKSFDDIRIDDCYFYFRKEWSCMCESGYDHSSIFPIEALFSDEELIKFIIEKNRGPEYEKRFEQMYFDCE